MTRWELECGSATAIAQVSRSVLRAIPQGLGTRRVKNGSNAADCAKRRESSRDTKARRTLSLLDTNFFSFRNAVFISSQSTQRIFSLYNICTSCPAFVLQHVGTRD